MVNIQQLAKGTPWEVVKLFRLAQNPPGLKGNFHV